MKGPDCVKMKTLSVIPDIGPNMDLDMDLIIFHLLQDSSATTWAFFFAMYIRFMNI